MMKTHNFLLKKGFLIIVKLLIIMAIAIELTSCEDTSENIENQVLGWDQDTITNSYINARGGTSPVNVYAVGKNGVASHYNGIEWTQEHLGTGSTLHDIWGSSSSNIYSIAELGRTPHFDGTSWNVLDNNMTYQYGIWGSSESDVYIAGNNGYVGHFNGTAWSKSRPSGLKDYLDVWGSSASDVFVVGSYSGAIILHFDGTIWTSTIPDIDINQLTAIWGFSSSDVYAVGRNKIIHYDGFEWTLVWDEGQRLNDIWGSSAMDIYSVGTAGTVIHWDGMEWKKIDIGVSGDLKAIWGSSATDIFIAGNREDRAGGIIYHYGPQ